MADLLLPADTSTDSIIEGFEEDVQGERAGGSTGKSLRVGEQFDEREAASQGGVEKMDAAVRRVHGAR